MKNRIFAGLICLILSGCGGMSLPSAPTIDGGHGIPLSGDQKRVIKAGVREIVAKVAPESAPFARLRGVQGFRSKTAALINVCGEVSYKRAQDKSVATVPFFLELANKQGSPFAKRGQVGYDKLKKAKVVYLCKKANGG